jgi:uncharacterized protein with FMN-binding domain
VSIVRRVILAFLATLIGTSVMVGIKAAAQSSAGNGVANAPLAPGAQTAGPGGALGGGAPGAGAPGASQVPGKPGAPGTTTKPGTPGQTPTPGGPTGGGPGTTPPTTPTHTPTPTSTATSVTVSGFSCRTQYGSVRVTVTVTGTHIDKVTYSDSTTQPRNAPATLAAQIISTQSANGLSKVSGATYTSAAFIASAQNALYGTPLNTTIAPFKGHVSSCA